MPASVQFRNGGLNVELLHGDWVVHRNNLGWLAGTHERPDDAQANGSYGGVGRVHGGRFVMLVDGADIELRVEHNLAVQFGDAALDIHTRIEVGVLHQRLRAGTAYARLERT